MSEVDTTMQRAQWLLAQGQFAPAEAMLRAILVDQPAHFQALCGLGVLMAQSRRAEQAVELLDRALQVEPSQPDALLARGIALGELGRHDEAADCYAGVLALQPASVLAHYNRGAALRKLGRLDEALASYDQALAIQPDLVEALVNRAVTLTALGRPMQAIESCDQALRVRPGHLRALNNRGVAFSLLQQHAQAIASYDAALALQPDYVEAITNRGIALVQRGQYALALEAFAAALLRKPQHAEAHFYAGCTHLLLGDFARGWPEYEWRWRTERFGADPAGQAQPRWTGQEDLRGRALLLHCEQGVGDTLQFWRYVREVAARGARVTVVVQAPLANLLGGAAGPVRVVRQGDALPAFDYFCPLLSLPLALNVTPRQLEGTPYLSADPARCAIWRTRLAPPAGGGPRIGLVWRGNPMHSNDRARSIPLACLGASLDARADYVCLQKELHPEDAERLRSWRGPRVAFHGAALADFADTAALVDLMDLVITVDTAVAHLAGALGKAVWILLPFSPDWRWQLDRIDSPWYSSARLFRQPAPGDWESVCGALRIALATLLAR
jgi:tetratricopeptide (TPR) repeat protein